MVEISRKIVRLNSTKIMDLFFYIIEIKTQKIIKSKIARLSLQKKYINDIILTRET